MQQSINLPTNHVTRRRNDTQIQANLSDGQGTRIACDTNTGLTHATIQDEPRDSTAVENDEPSRSQSPFQPKWQITNYPILVAKDMLP